MTAFSPQLQLETLYILNKQGRILTTRDHHLSPGARFVLIRSASACAWAIRADIQDSLAAHIDDLARQEIAVDDLRRQPVHAERYTALLGGRIDSGPAFTFPESLPHSTGTIVIDEVAMLKENFQGWSARELPDCSPIVGVVEQHHAISVCFSARTSTVSAEAGVETTARFRGRGLGSRVTAAWAWAVRGSGRLPLYSTSWSNKASLGVARKLGLEMCASDWSLWDEHG